MSPEQHKQAGALFHELCDLPEAERAARLDAASDPEVRRHVAALLSAERQAPPRFLSRPAIEVAARLLQPLSGTVIGNYRLGVPIGAGGMGAVYEAHDLRLNRRVAVKILPPAFVSDPVRVRRFLQEARAVSSLNHPNIVSLYDADQDQGIYYIATEFVEGQTLRRLMSQGRLDSRTALEVAGQIASALGAAHDAGMVHRDIKPENVMLRPDGFVKVLDFGLAKLADPSSAGAHGELDTRPGNVPGTLPYLSPEQVLGKPAGPRSDLFSLGVVLYEMATGARPFEGPTDLAILDAIVNRAPTPPSRLNPSVGPALESEILRTLEKDPDLRFQTAADLRSALRRLGRDSNSTPLPAAVEARPRRNRGLAAFALAIAGVAVAAAVAWLAGSFHQAPRLPVKFERITDAPGEEIFPNLSPNGGQFFYASAARGKWDIYLQRTGGEKAVNLTADSKDDDTQPALSPDGAKIAFRSEREGGGLFIMEATGENPRRIARQGYLPAWSPDGQSIVYSDVNFIVPSSRLSPASRLHILDLASGAERKLETGDAMQPKWSPHGYRIAYWGLAAGVERDIFTVDARSGAPVQVTNDPALDWNPVWSPAGDYLYFLSDRGGAMNVWRVRIDERSGQTRGDPEPVTTPADSVAYLSFAADGRSFAYAQARQRTNLFVVGYDAARQQVTGEPALVGSGAHNMTVFSLSPDDRRLVYDTVGDAQEDLWIMNSDGSGRRRLTDDPFKDRSPAWSPNGEAIVFMSDRSGRLDDWTIRPDGSELRQLTATARPMQRPVWTADGKQVFGSRNPGLPVLLDPHPAAPAAGPRSLPGLEEFDGALFSPFPAHGAMLVAEWPGDKGWELIFYDLAKGVATRPGVFGRRPAWMPGDRQVIFGRGPQCLLYDVASRREKALFSVAPNTLYEIHATRDARRIFFTQTIREADLWLGRMGK